MSFYHAFEERHRGTREDIKARLGAYRPFLEALRGAGAQAIALDLGCGRGEWLEVLGEGGIRARGVDLDDGMLAEAARRGLAAERGDALSAIRAAPEESLDLVSAFHVVEHLPFADVEALVRESLRVLQPGGLLVLETPNPDNFAVGTSRFYLDPTHLRPIPSPLLAFLPEYHGFARTHVLRLNAPAGVATNRYPTLTNVLMESSPDYAVVAQKAGPASVLAAFDAAFARELGVSAGDLAERFDAAQGNRDTRLEDLEQLARRAHELAVHAQHRAVEAEETVRQLVRSSSWRITAPLRAVVGTANRLRSRLRRGGST